MNWGKKLILGMASFMIFIVVLGSIMIMRSDNDALIENDYYEKGQTYDKVYNAKKDAADDMITPVITTDQYGVTITFPVAVEYKLHCKRSSDYRMDKIIKGNTDNNCTIKLMKGDLAPGPWLLKIEYTPDEKIYLFEGEIMMP
ncbi:MAG TPA: FixH family protein [Sphingobacteriaceae bacterium]